jgi:hypothetical protein
MSRAGRRLAVVSHASALLPHTSANHMHVQFARQKGYKSQYVGVVPLTGLEPVTPALRMRCSTS